MVIVLDANGNVMQCTPEKIHQGSNKANTIVVLSPLTAGLSATIAYKLPNGTWSYPVLMTPTKQDNEELNAWTVDIDRSLTDYYGTVDLQVSFYTTGEPVYDEEDNIVNYTGDCICSALCTFEVLKGVTPINPAVPEDNVYESILTLLSNISTSIMNGELLSKGILPYDYYFTYPLGALVQDNGTFYKSLANNNEQHALTDTEYWEKIVIPTASQTTLGGIYCWYADGKLNISTTPV